MLLQGRHRSLRNVGRSKEQGEKDFNVAALKIKIEGKQLGMIYWITFPWGAEKRAQG